MDAVLGWWVRWVSQLHCTSRREPPSHREPSCREQLRCREQAGRREPAELARGFTNDETPRQNTVVCRKRGEGGQIFFLKLCNLHFCDIYFDCLPRQKVRPRRQGFLLCPKD